MKILIALLIMLAFSAATISAQTTAFTYQGRLTDSAMPGTASYLMEFKLFAQASGGTAIDTLSDVPVSVANNVFTVQLNFTAANAFDGIDRFLEISVKRTAGDPYTLLTPRQPITSAPYSIRSLSAGTADTATTAASAANFTGNLSGDVSGTQGATVVNTVGGQTAADVGNATQVVNTATSANTPDTLVRRDANGAFSANRIVGLASPIGGNDAATKAYVDAAVTPRYAQVSWSGTTNHPSGAWSSIPSSILPFTTTGKPLLITMNLGLVNGSHGTCRPIIGGVWAGSYGGLPNPGDPFWQEGLIGVGAVGGAFARWNSSRIYPGVPAGNHTFQVQCATDGGTMQSCAAASVGCSFGVIELH